MTYADIHARSLAQAGWSYGFTSYVNGDGRRMIVAHAHRDGVRLIVHAEKFLTVKNLCGFEADGERANGLRRHYDTGMGMKIMGGTSGR